MMDTIKVVQGESPYMIKEHLSIYVNEERLDLLLSRNMNDDSYIGLILSWLDYYDDDFEPSLKEKHYVLKKTMLGNDTKILPILLCPDDFDFSCNRLNNDVQS